MAEMMKYPIAENFEHKADIGVRGKGRTLAEAFVGAAISMMGIMFDSKCVRAEKTIEIKCDADDIEALLVEWLNALLSKRDLESMVLCRFEAEIGAMGGDGEDASEKLLSGKAWGEKYDPKRHEAKLEVKAATYSQLKVFQEEGTGLWVAQCIVDV
jgi:SHS2 domain-containing protein